METWLKEIANGRRWGDGLGVFAEKEVALEDVDDLMFHSVAESMKTSEVEGGVSRNDLPGKHYEPPLNDGASAPENRSCQHDVDING